MKRFPLVVLVLLMTAVSAASVQKTQPRVDEIVLEARQGEDMGEPFGPGFKITLRRDGTASFIGKAKVKLIGDFQGAIGSKEFEQLLSFLVARKYDRIPDDPINAHRVGQSVGLSAYSGSPHMITVIVFEGGQTKTIFRPTTANGIDQSRVPKALLEIEQAVFDAATRIRWAKIK